MTNFLFIGKKIKDYLVLNVFLLENHINFYLNSKIYIKIKDTKEVCL